MFDLDRFPNYSIVHLDNSMHVSINQCTCMVLKINWMLSPCIYTYVATDLSPDLWDGYYNVLYYEILSLNEITDLVLACKLYCMYLHPSMSGYNVNKK